MVGWVGVEPTMRNRSRFTDECPTVEHPTDMDTLTGIEPAQSGFADQPITTLAQRI